MLGDDWPSPPAYQYLVVENPYPLGGALVLLAVGLFIAGGRQERGVLQLASLGAALAAAGIFIAAHFVVTERERLQNNTRDIVNAFADPFQPDLLRSHITEDVRLFDSQVAHLMPVAEHASEQVEVEQYFIRRVLVEQDGPRHARTGVSVIGRMQHRMGSNGFTVQAIFHWRLNSDDQWKLYRVPDVSLNGRDARPIVERFAGL